VKSNAKLDILFIHSNASKSVYQGLSNSHSAIEPPIWAAMLASSIRAHGGSVAIFDAEAERVDYLEAASRIADYGARINCFVVYGQQPSASSQNMVGACATAQLVFENSPESFNVFVGGHVAALPEETLRCEPAIKAVCQNEGVYTLRSLIEIDVFDDSELRKVKGLVFRNSEGAVEQNQASQLVPHGQMEIDLPMPAWDLLPSFDSYRTAGWHSWSNGSEKEPFAALYTTLGCPYRCSFCMINIINRTDSSADISSADSNLYRRWSPQFVIKQFDYFAEKGVRNIKIADELFVLNPNHFGKVCELIVERGYDFNIWAYSRVDTCKPKYLDLLRAAGVRWLGLGIENPNEIMRREIHKDGYKDVKIMDLIDEIRSSGINVGGNYIFGLPDDTQESMEATLDFAMENLTDMTNFYSAMAYPGSPLHLEARRSGTPLPSSYSGYSQHSYDTLNLSNAYLTAEDILRFRDDAWMKYHTNESYLKLLESKFGAHAREDLEKTTKISLKRKLLGD
jgi:anaerobic magnesium-protoporphyrin IX monomethyl ester cyclase